MVCNVSRWGRIGRLVFGGLLVAWAIGRGPTWTWSGLIVMATGAWRFCPVLWTFGIRKISDSEKHATGSAPRR